ncbi:MULTISPECIES: CsbD family protein [Corynebacterium]|uniref:CsbD family protein n=1 Tax=Corynebacterium TaxID=1716 RepID=UPI000D7CAE1E|nr:MULTISPECIES: CsbD family protein [Corynebacterium]MCI1257121.1 CsbD family protein [Corynebacterium provencense]
MDDAKNKAEGLAGQAKEALGDATGNESLENEGRADQVRSEVKEKFEEIKDKVTDAANRIIGGAKD